MQMLVPAFRDESIGLGWFGSGGGVVGAGGEGASASPVQARLPALDIVLSMFDLLQASFCGLLILLGEDRGRYVNRVAGVVQCFYEWATDVFAVLCCIVLFLRLGRFLPMRGPIIIQGVAVS